MTKNGITTSYTYNAEGNRLTGVGGATLTYDTAGNLTGDGTATYTWNNAGRLQQVNTGSTTVSFTYDALGRRSSKTVNGTTETYHFDGGRVAYVTDASGTVLRRFTYADDGRPLYMGQGGTLYYYHTNAHGDVVSLTDASGNVVARYQYDAWGNILSVTNPSNPSDLTVANANPYRYAGYWYDSETQLYYLNARYYKPAWGRFISRDRLLGQVGDPLSHNLYAYVGNNPLTHVDPLGLYQAYEGDGGSHSITVDEALFVAQTIGSLAAGVTGSAAAIAEGKGISMIGHVITTVAAPFASGTALGQLVDAVGSTIRTGRGLPTIRAPMRAIAGFAGRAVNVIQMAAGAFDIYQSFQNQDRREAMLAGVSGSLKIASGGLGLAAVGATGTILGAPAGVVLGVASGTAAFAAWGIDNFRWE